MNNNILFPKLLGTYKPKADREECGTPVTAERVFGGDDTTEGEKKRENSYTSEEVS